MPIFFYFQFEYHLYILVCMTSHSRGPFPLLECPASGNLFKNLLTCREGKIWGNSEDRRRKPDGRVGLANAHSLEIPVSAEPPYVPAGGVVEGG